MYISIIPKNLDIADYNTWDVSEEVITNFGSNQNSENSIDSFLNKPFTTSHLSIDTLLSRFP